MKKIVLSIVALMVIVLNVKAADEPTYTATGTAGGYYTSYNYVAIYTGSVPKVEVYESSEGVKDKVIVRSWCGVEGYDMAITFDSKGSVTGAYPIINGEEKKPTTESNYSFVDTGITKDYVVACVGNAYFYTWQSDDKTTEYVWFAPYMYVDTECSKYLSGSYEYYLSWSVPTSTGISSISADSSADAPLYNLSGQRVSNGAKGLIIKNGKKCFNK